VAKRPGVVYLVGAGPGDPGLLTRRGEALLRAADVVVYDRLVAPSLLDLSPPTAEKIFVGKEGGGPSVPQRETTELLIERGLAGQCVVRLKGGDPFVFGRGGEEALDLRRAGVPFEIVPGVTSAIAAPAYAGIPVTHRGLASSVTFATGHEDPTKPESSIDWSRLARGGDTLVFLMGVEHLATIATHLIAAGRDPAEPSALVRWGTIAQQRTLRAPLGQIATLSREQDFRPPAVLVVGAVVDLAADLNWFERRPLFGRRILVTRAREQASALSEQLLALGAEPLEFPTIRIEPLADPEPLDRAVERLGQADWVILTSANGVRAVFERLTVLGRDARVFASTRVAAIGPATAASLLEHGIRPDFVPSAFTSEAIARELAPLVEPGQQVVLLRADIAPRILADQLARSGAEVENVAAYRTMPDLAGRDQILRRLERRQIDVVTFTSSSTVRNLVEGLGPARTNLLDDPLLACIGPVTSATARELGLRVDLEASVHTVDGLVQALVERLGQTEEATA
jgi:uroporphyrinogen III methyltransferase/synthase